MMLAVIVDTSSPGFWMLLVPSLTTLIFALAGWLNAQKAVLEASLAAEHASAAKQLARAAATLGRENQTKLIEVGLQFDGRLSQLLAETEKAQRALGITEGQDKERDISAKAAIVASEKAKEIVELAAIKATEILKTAADLKATVEVVPKKEPE